MKAHITNLVFNDGTSIDLNYNDIVVFVGPNNTGKSQTLRDIYSLTKRPSSGCVLSSLSLKKDKGSIKDLLDGIAREKNTDSGSCQYEINGKSYHFYQGVDSTFNHGDGLDKFTDLFIANLTTEARLRICQPAQYNSNNDKSNPIHFAAFDEHIRNQLSDSFKKAFGTGLMPNKLNGNTIPLIISDPIKNELPFDDVQKQIDYYSDHFNTLPQVHEQGDGIRSFVGILLYLILDYYSIYLLDEPESFLYPPQAKIMGDIIGSTLKDDQQAFIATHSEELIKGLMESCPNRLKIVRIDRPEHDINTVSVLSNKDLNNIWQDSILKYSNIMSGLFYKSVVICESDSDCKIYSIINDYLRHKDGYYSESLFIHCNGKHRLHKIAKALKSLNVQFTVVGDLDLLKEKENLEKLLVACEGDWSIFDRDYRVLCSALSNDFEDIKKHGVASVPSGHASEAINNIISNLHLYNIALVPVGEVENFIKDAGGHGNGWVDNVLEKHPDLDDRCYDGIKDFVKSLEIL